MGTAVGIARFTNKIAAAKLSILYSPNEKLAFDPSKISAVKFSILYYLSLIIS